MQFATECEASPLGSSVNYSSVYQPQLLYPIERGLQRQQWKWSTGLPFHGADLWTAYELSWLDSKGKPVAATATLTFTADSPYLVESKSLKLYLGSLHQTLFSDVAAIRQVICDDLTKACGALVGVDIYLLSAANTGYVEWQGTCLDAIDVEVEHYRVNQQLLQTNKSCIVSESVYTHLFKSNCPVTGQPDWASVLICYKGPQIDHASLLAYLISYRQHTDFHEHCVEAIFTDLQQYCAADQLSVYARYVRRGGLDINPFRSNFEAVPANERLWRQ
jgi:7-cyano-7-deazaguanine reductase